MLLGNFSSIVSKGTALIPSKFRSIVTTKSNFFDESDE
jgi:hypothetical protein